MLVRRCSVVIQFSVAFARVCPVPPTSDVKLLGVPSKVVNREVKGSERCRLFADRVW